MLDEIGMRSESCTSGQDAVAAVQRALDTALPFYAAILDWKMPGMDGLDTARAIKRLVGDTLPIIILSAYDWSDIEMEARAAGIDAFLSKPVFKSGLIRMFKSLRNEEPEDTSQASPLELLSQNDFSGRRILLAEDIDLNHPDAQRIPIIAMTADAFVEDIQAAKAAGMNEHLSKPIDFEALGSVLKKYL